jgi:hypothetical protein
MVNVRVCLLESAIETRQLICRMASGTGNIDNVRMYNDVDHGLSVADAAIAQSVVFAIAHSRSDLRHNLGVGNEFNGCPVGAAGAHKERSEDLVMASE